MSGSTPFDYTGGTVTWTIPTTGLYDITGYGAQGGNGTGPGSPRPAVQRS